MIPEKMFHSLLGLGDGWRIQSVDNVKKDCKVLIRVEETAALWATEVCPHGQGKAIGGYDPAPERRWRHLNVCQLPSEMVCALPQGECKACPKVSTVRAPWEGRSRGLTQAFEAFALTLTRELPVSKAGEILGETDQKLWRALFAHVATAWAELGSLEAGIDHGVLGRTQQPLLGDQAQGARLSLQRVSDRQALLRRW